MPSSCKICHHSGPAMFTFPKSQAAITNWKLAMKIPEKTSVTSFRACYKHFQSDNIKATLKIDYDLVDKEGKEIDNIKVPAK